MSYSFIITVEGVVDGSTVVPIPDPLPQDQFGFVTFTVSALGILDIASLQNLLGVEAMCMIAVGFEAAPTVVSFSVGIVRPGPFTDMQAVLAGLNPTAAVLSASRGPYIPKGWRTRLIALDGGGNPASGTHVFYVSFHNIDDLTDLCAANFGEAIPVSV